MIIDIYQDDLQMKITKLTPLTTELFQVYAKYFNRENKIDDEDKTLLDKKYKETIVEKENQGKWKSDQSFNDKDILVRSRNSDYNTTIYKTVMDYVREHCDNISSTKSISESIFQFYTKMNKKIARSTALTYAVEYHRYLEKEAEKKESKEEKSKLPRAPDNTALFYHWIKTTQPLEFTIDDFLESYPTISQEQIEKIVSHQISLNNLQQGGIDGTDNKKFKVLQKLRDEVR